MPAQDPDIIVVGSGPNGLVAACVLAREGFHVRVLDANPRRPGGAVRSETLTLPGFVHDAGASFFPFAHTSPAFADLNLPALGVEWLNAPIESCHLAADGGHVCLARTLDACADPLGAPKDVRQWQRLAAQHAAGFPELVNIVLRPVARSSSMRRLGMTRTLQLLSLARARAGSQSRRWFSSDAGRGLLPSLAAHLGAGPWDRWSTGYGLVLALAAISDGFALPRGGAQSVTNALVTLLERHGGKLQLGARAARLLISDRRAAGVALESGDEVRATRGVLIAGGAAPLLRELCASQSLATHAAERANWRSAALGLYKLDWALSTRVPWIVKAARQSAVVHTGVDVTHVDRATRQAQNGHLPESPCLTVGQPTLADPDRAPSNHHVASCVVRVPRWPAAQWEQVRNALADRVEAQIEALAPGFRGSIVARHVATPPDLERTDDGPAGGMDAAADPRWHRGLARRLLSPGAEYRTPIRGLYLCSGVTYPGPGAHGMCGHNAARAAARDLA